MPTKIWTAFSYADGVAYSEDGGSLFSIIAQDPSWKGIGYLYGYSETRIIAAIAQQVVFGTYYPIAEWDGVSWTVDTSITVSKTGVRPWCSSNEIFFVVASSGTAGRTLHRKSSGSWSTIDTLALGHQWADVHGVSNSCVVGCAGYYVTNEHYVRRWNGSTMDQIYTSSEAGYPCCVYVVDEDSIWYAWAKASDYTIVIEHWNGSSWTVTHSAIYGTLAQSTPTAFSFVDTNSGWLVFDGYQEAGGPILHWNGSIWTSQTLPPEVNQFDAFYGVYAASETEVYATAIAGVENHLIKFDGVSWTDITPSDWLVASLNLQPIGIYAIPEVIPVTETDSFKNYFNVQRIDFIAQPVPRNIWNQFDEHAATTSLTRLPGEKNWEFKRRILDNAVNRGNSSYKGIINSATRELGLSQYNAIIINPKLKDDGTFLAPDPRVEIRGKYVYLYSDFSRGLLANQVDRLTEGGNYECLGWLVDFINTSLYFEAHLSPGVGRHVRSSVLLDQTNVKPVDAEEIPGTTKFRLEHYPVVPSSIQFARRDTFVTEVSSEDAVHLLGQYHIDYFNGIIKCFSIPGYGEHLRYKYVLYPFEAKASPVIVYNMNDEDFKNHIFQQVLQDDGTWARSLPNVKGTNILNELLSAIAMYWGQ